MTLRLCSLLCIFLLQACGTVAFTPTAYPLRDGLIPSFPVVGTTTIQNNQPSTAQAIVYSHSGTTLVSNLNVITAMMVQQASDELHKNGKISGGTQGKSIALKVNSLLSDAAFYHFNSKIQFEAALGNGIVISKEVTHSSMDIRQDLNGCIAEGVMKLFNDPQLLAYLAK